MDSPTSSELASYLDSDYDSEDDFRLCIYCIDEPDDTKCSLCNCWEYACHTADPWACREACDCETCADYRTEFPFPMPAYACYPLTPSTIYDRSDVKELHRFVVDRSLKDPQPNGITEKRIYYRVLRAADERARFRFLDLPAGMRNHVYRDLLIFPRARARSDTTCYPAILRTSRKINKEGHDILYGENVFKVAIMQGHTNDVTSKRSVRVHDRFFLHTCSHNMFSRLPEGVDSYQAPLKLLQQLEINIKFACNCETQGRVGGIGYEFTSTVLLTLSSSLMEGNKLKKVTIRFESVGKHDLEIWELGNMLYPLRRLREIEHVTVSGDLPKKMCTFLQNSMQQEAAISTPTHNTLRHWKFLSEEGRARVILMQQLRGIECDCGHCHGKSESCIFDLRAALENLAQYQAYEADGPVIQSFAEEANLQARLASVQRCLKATKIAELKRNFDNVVEAEKKRRMFEKTAPAEVLRDAEALWDEYDLDDFGAEVGLDDEWGFGDYTWSDKEDLAG